MSAVGLFIFELRDAFEIGRVVPSNDAGNSSWRAAPALGQTVDRIVSHRNRTVAAFILHLSA